MYGTFNVTATVTVDSFRWSSAGYGVTPSSSQVRAIIHQHLWASRAPSTGLSLYVTVVPKSRGTQFHVTARLSVTTPWWKLGFGKRTSRMEVSDIMADAVNGFGTLSNLVVKSV